MKNNLFLTTIVFFCFLTNVYAENGHVDLKFLSENVSSLASTQNLSGFGIEVYKKFKSPSIIVILVYSIANIKKNKYYNPINLKQLKR